MDVLGGEYEIVSYLRVDRASGDVEFYRVVGDMQTRISAEEYEEQ